MFSGWWTLDFGVSAPSASSADSCRFPVRTVRYRLGLSKRPNRAAFGTLTKSKSFGKMQLVTLVRLEPALQPRTGGRNPDHFVTKIAEYFALLSLLPHVKCLPAASRVTPSRINE